MFRQEYFRVLLFLRHKNYHKLQLFSTEFFFTTFRYGALASFDAPKGEAIAPTASKAVVNVGAFWCACSSFCLSSSLWVIYPRLNASDILSLLSCRVNFIGCCNFMRNCQNKRGCFMPLVRFRPVLLPVADSVAMFPGFRHNQANNWLPQTQTDFSSRRLWS